MEGIRVQKRRPSKVRGLHHVAGKGQLMVTPTLGGLSKIADTM